MKEPVAKVGACERLRNVPNRLGGVHKKYQERVPGGSMRTVVQMGLVGLSLYDGVEDYEFWPTSTESSATTSGRTRSGALGIGSRSRRVERNR